MSPLLKKELRLLLPAWLATMALALAPAALLPWPDSIYDWEQHMAPMRYCFLLGLVFLAIAPFGLECNCKTLSLSLVQPVSRATLWRTKGLTFLAGGVLALLAFSAVVWTRALLAAQAPGVQSAEVLAMARPWLWETLLLAVTILSTGLWTTLLLRQMAGAFCITLLLPLALFGLFGDLWPVPALYAITSVFLARWLFLRAQDTAWAGGNLTLGMGGGGLFAGRRTPGFNPLPALLQKEFQLQRVTLLSMAGLFILNLAVIAFRNMTADSTHVQSLRSSLEFFGFIWLVMPLFAGCLSITEERKLGTLSEQFCLPVARWLQFVLKLLVTVLIGMLLTAALSLSLDWFSARLFHKGPASLFLQNPENLLIAIGILCLSAFYASTLTRNILQSLLVSILVAAPFLAGWWLMYFVCASLMEQSDFFLFSPMPQFWVLSALLCVPTLIVVLSWLAYSNFGTLRTTRAFWQRNLLAISATVAGAMLLACLFQARCWEWFQTNEPPHGPAQLALNKPFEVSICQSRQSLYSAAVLSDGRLWFGRQPIEETENQDVVYSPFDERGFIGGSNWAQVQVNRQAMAALQTNGSLWLANSSPAGSIRAATNLVRFGVDSDWCALMTGWKEFLLLKTNGTLWRLPMTRDSNPEHRQYRSGYQFAPPQQIGTASDWARLIPRQFSESVVQKRNGEAWLLRYIPPSDTNHPPDVELMLAPPPAIPDAKAILPVSYGSIFVKADGTLWSQQTAWQEYRKSPRAAPATLVDANNHWKAIVSTWDGPLLGLKEDGSLWRSAPDLQPSDLSHPLHWERLGSRSDWVGLGRNSPWGTLVAISADGGFYLWPYVSISPGTFVSDRQSKRTWRDIPWKQGLLSFTRPSRRPQFAGNIFQTTN
jgi:hypothetical protein